MVSTSSTARVCAALWLAAGLAGCRTTDAPERASHNLDLLALLDGAEVSISDQSVILGPAEAAEPQDLILVEEMAGPLANGWWPARSGGRGALPAVVEVDGESALVLEASESPVAILLPAEPDDAYGVRVRWRAEAPGRASLSARGFLGAPERFDDLGEVRAFVDREAQRSASSSLRMELQSGTGWQETELRIEPELERRALLLRLGSLEGTAQVDRLEVRRLTPIERFVIPAVAQEGRSILHRRVMLPEESFEALLLPAGSSVSYEVAVPSTSPRLDTEVRVLGGSPEAGEFVLRLDGVALGKRRVEPAAVVGFEGAPWRVPLEGQGRVELELSFDGAPGSVGILSAPRVLGSGDPRPAVVLISLDTLRADHLGTYGESRALSPHIDRLASRGTLFERVVSPASYTLPTHVTILTGQHPLTHGVRRPNQRIDGRRSTTLTERLRDEGYVTTAFTAGGYVDPVFGFSVGFDSYRTRDPAEWEESRAGAVPMAHVVDWMDRHDDQPYFLFVHTYLVHGYLPRRRHLDLASPDSGIRLEAPGQRERHLSIERRFKRLIDRAQEGDVAAVEILRKLYAGTVVQADQEVVGALLEAVERRAAAGGETIVVVLSDHGEEFLEHGGFGHGEALWGELVDVPLVLRGPGVPAGVRRPGPVGLDDVAPTILGLLGLPASEHQTGRDLFAADSKSDGVVVHHLLDDGSRWDGLVEPRWKLLRHQARDDLEWYLFDLRSEAGEGANLAAAHPEVLDRMKARLQEGSRRLLAASPSITEGQGDEDELPETLVRELRSLGYVDN